VSQPNIEEQGMLPSIGAFFLEVLFQPIIKMDPTWTKNVAPLTGAVIELELFDLPFHLYFMPHSSGMIIQASFPDKSDVKISGPVSGFIQLIQARRKHETLVGSSVQFAGNVAIGQHFEKLLASLRPQWEEQLSRLMGDPLTQTLIGLGQNLSTLFSQTTQTLQTNTKDYFQEEARFTPAAIEVQNFSDDVANLRSDVSRIEAKIKRLQSQKPLVQKSVNPSSNVIPMENHPMENQP